MALIETLLSSSSEKHVVSEHCFYDFVFKLVRTGPETHFSYFEFIDFDYIIR